MTTITTKRAIDLRKGDVVGDEFEVWYVCEQDAVRASRAKGCQVAVRFSDGGLDTRVWDDTDAPVPVREEAE